MDLFYKIPLGARNFETDKNGIPYARKVRLNNKEYLIKMDGSFKAEASDGVELLSMFPTIVSEEPWTNKSQEVKSVNADVVESLVKEKETLKKTVAKLEKEARENVASSELQKSLQESEKQINSSKDTINKLKDRLQNLSIKIDSLTKERNAYKVCYELFQKKENDLIKILTEAEIEVSKENPPEKAVKQLLKKMLEE